LQRRRTEVGGVFYFPPQLKTFQLAISIAQSLTLRCGNASLNIALRDRNANCGANDRINRIIRIPTQ
jgi:hypothetical protein